LKAQANLGVTLIEAKNYREAISALRAAILLAPNNADLRTNLGIALERSSKLTEAQQAYDEAKKLKVLPATHSAAVAKP
jgi:Flp pilus assembly protein TadD